MEMARLFTSFINLNISNKIAVILLFIVLVSLFIALPVLTKKKKLKEKE